MSTSDLEDTTVFIDEDFSDASGSTPPPGWTTEVLEGNPATDVWRFDNPGNRAEISEPYNPNFDNPVAVYDSDKLSDDNVPENIAFESPVFNASTASGVFLTFDQFYGGFSTGENASEAIVEAYNGSTWQEVYSSNTGSFDINTQTLDLTNTLAGVQDAQIRFRFDGNWSYLWAIDNVKVVDALPIGVVAPTSLVGVSEDNVSDPLSFQFSLNSRPTSDVTLTFNADRSQLQAIAPITFTPDNWLIPQARTVTAVADDIEEGNEQTSSVEVTVSSEDSDYNGLIVNDVPVEITENVIPGFTSYRTVEQTYRDLSQLASANPNIASWIDIGDSYDKITPGGDPGYDLRVLELTNKNVTVPGDKPVLYVEAGIHAREYSTNEVLTRFAEYLVTNYGKNADITWILDYFQLDLNPVVNPDGRKFAEQGYSWRKNTNPKVPPGVDPAPFPDYGVDLNRNHDFRWGTVPGGSSGDPADLTYRGASPASEPETKAVEDFVGTLFPGRQGASQTTPADENASGLFIDLHSYGNTVLYPWGSTYDPAPNREGLRNLGLKFGYYTASNGTPYDIYQSIGLYPTDGTTDDWAYGTFGVPSYTWELGTDFFEPSEYFEESIAPQIIPALLYAAKSAYRPYQTADGPESVGVATDLGQVAAGTVPVVLSATGDDTRYADSNNEGLEEGTELPPSQDIAAARYSIDAPSWIPGTQLYSLRAADGNFNTSVEGLQASIDTSSLALGRHTIFVESQDGDGNWGVPSAVFLDVVAASEDATVIDGTDGRNTLIGGDGNEIFYGRAGNDTIRTGDGDDLILAGDGDDAAQGNAGDDVLYGGNGNDRLNGKGGDDSLYGNAGDDQLIGFKGDDLLDGGEGDDTLSGGEGRDQFVLRQGDGSDIIGDFKVNKDVLSLVDGLTFGDLTLTQRNGNTQLSIASDDELLATLVGVQVSTLGAGSFVAA
ncbi:M14 family zinc carboxypeptidase [Leptolyngbya sp. FACHB-261]|uniref:M14 family zinc carboxypeptidase n=1 Tax=Leptolyngbya sp. FACHB-261 TaxID=2692806 RepID=UPI00168555F5|nr:M14 family zinc carboxypeptidase [Leptolyngbya sp. FACHB-261]MBD2101954.1 hypothetical protein [Leptolyngbya sp. FACHB-261]